MIFLLGHRIFVAERFVKDILLKIDFIKELKSTCGT